MKKRISANSLPSRPKTRTHVQNNLTMQTPELSVHASFYHHMKKHVQARVIAFIARSVFVSAGVLPVFAQASPLGQFDGHDDIGSPKLPGGATYNAMSQEYGNA